jgi:hypothetical protein
VTYEDEKARLRAQLENEFIRVKELESRFIDLVTEKIMSEGFNKEFYRGVGGTTSAFSGPPIRLNFKTKYKALLKSLGIILFTIVQIVKTRRKPGSSVPLGLIYAVPERHYASYRHRDKLKHFLDSTLIQSGIEPPLQYLLQSGTLRKFKNNESVEVVSHIGCKILSSWSPNKPKTLCEIVGRTFAWLKISSAHSSIFLVGGEYVVDSLAIEIMKQQQKFVLITTQSQLLAPPLLFKSEIHASRIMYWYSDNSIQISTKGSMPRDYSYLRQGDIDTHFVWTNSWARVLFKHNQSCLIIPIGPVLFEPLETKTVISKSPRTRPKNILIFDVTPKEGADPLSYYSEKIMTSFISDIVETVLGISPNSTIRLKPKRKYTKGDSVGYRNYLENKEDIIERLGFNSDLQREILNSDLVICVPFTSPGLVATYLEIPTIYYSSSQDYDLNHESIRVISGRESLRKFLLQEIF